MGRRGERIFRGEVCRVVQRDGHVDQKRARVQFGVILESKYSPTQKRATGGMYVYNTWNNDNRFNNQ